MSGRRGGSGRGRRKKTTNPRDFWGDPEAIEATDDLISPAAQPAAMVRSLGHPPLPGREAVSEHYFTAVYERASGLAIALAAAAGVLDDDSLD